MQHYHQNRKKNKIKVKLYRLYAIIIKFYAFDINIEKTSIINNKQFISISSVTNINSNDNISVISKNSKLASKKRKRQQNKTEIVQS